MTILLHNLPNITVLCIRPLHPFLQIALLEGYSAKLVMLKIHSSIGEASSWGTVNLPCLETLEIVEDCSDMQGSLVTHFTKYVCAPKLRNASLVAATEMPVFGVIEFLIAFGELLEVVKVIGTIVPYGRDRTIFPPLPNVRIASLELVLATEFLTRTPGGVVRWPKLETLILESDWLTIETEFFREVNWVGLKECLLILTPPPTIICGYRASVPVLGETFRRMFIDKIAKGTGGWDISSVFTVGQIKCDPMYQTIVE
ncbi:hypothetical protein VNI00_011046 [Paramarasmius palmivorus]|uniref:Uncharacterized protein n=1 Tax=Paramarasmius palmivorus TaxID=297713 RepID=A0AAW0CI75_9AGAR